MFPIFFTLTGDLTVGSVGLLIAIAPAVWATGSVLFGAGTAMAYPTLIAAVGDIAHPSWRGAAVGVYRWWRDVGFAVGAVLAGVLADLYSITVAIVVIAAITAASGIDVAVRMTETHRRAEGSTSDREPTDSSDGSAGSGGLAH